MKKSIAVFALMGAVALSSCGGSTIRVPSSIAGFGGEDTDYQFTSLTQAEKDAFVQSDCNVVVNYNGAAGPSYRMATPYKGVDGVTLVQDDLLPTWKFFQEELKLKIYDVDDYSKKNNNDVNTYYTGSNFVASNGKKVDLYANGTANIQKDARADQLEALSDHYDKMPHFKAWLDANPTTANQLLVNGKIYFSPYFDGKDTIEKMFMMNTSYVEKLLDAENPSYSTDRKITVSYNTPYIASMNKEPIVVVDPNTGKAVEIPVTIKEGKDIISRMNALDVKDGASLTNCLKTYLKDTYGAYVGTGSNKIFAKYSDIFCSASACYNADELIALMRCVRANSSMLTGQTEKAVEIIVPRSGEANRQRTVVEFTQMFGIRGTSSEKDRLFFDKDGVLHDGRTEEATYDAIELMNKLYKEGLIVENYYEGYGKYYKGLYNANLMKDGLEFMCYDYSATTVSYDKTTDTASKSEGFMPVLPPYAKWETGDATHTYSRFSEDNRALKDGGWCIPKTAANKDAAYRLLDFLFTKEGAYAQDFGPKTLGGNATNFWTEETTLLDGTVCPKISDAVLKAINNTKDSTGNNDNKAAGNWNNWYRYYVGATLGVGHIRSNGLDYQVNGKSGQQGLDNIKTAIACGALVVAKTTYKIEKDGKKVGGFFTSVRTNWDLSTSESSLITNNTKEITALWTESNPKSGEGTMQPYTNFVINGFTESTTTRAKITEMFKTTNTNYLATYAKYAND